jgi:hypothetical protein
MTILRQSRRRFLQSAAASGAALLVPQLIRPVLAQVPAGADLGALRDKIEHIVVIFQENRAFDHYFGAYQPPSGARIENLLDGEGNIDQRFFGLQKNPAGAAYPYLPVPYNIPCFAAAQLPNRPFPLGKYIPASANVLPIHDLRVANGCSTVCRRMPMASGIRSSLACIASRTPSCFQRLTRFGLSGVPAGLERTGETGGQMSIMVDIESERYDRRDNFCGTSQRQHIVDDCVRNMRSSGSLAG